MKQALHKGLGSPSPFRELSPVHIQKEDEPKFMRKTVCEGDYCNIKVGEVQPNTKKFSFETIVIDKHRPPKER